MAGWNLKLHTVLQRHAMLRIAKQKHTGTIKPPHASSAQLITIGSLTLPLGGRNFNSSSSGFTEKKPGTCFMTSWVHCYCHGSWPQENIKVPGNMEN
jgi:hypothetical protein